MNPAPSISSSNGSYTPIVIFSVLGAICLVLVIAGAIMVGKNSPEVSKRDSSAAMIRQRGVVMIVIGCIGAAAFGAFAGYSGHNYGKLMKERGRSVEVTMQRGNMTFGPVSIKGLGGAFRDMSNQALASVQGTLNF